jgi:hypothetical protein
MRTSGGGGGLWEGQTKGQRMFKGGEGVRKDSVPSVSPNCSQSVSNRLTLFLAGVISSTLNMEATCFFETSGYSKPTRRHIPEGGILHYQYDFILKI